MTGSQDRHDGSPSSPADEPGGAKAKGIFSCVVDEHPRFHLDALRWFVSLTTIAGVDPRDLVVHVVGPDTSDALAHLRSRGVTVRSIERFDPRSPHCNKVAGALRLAAGAARGPGGSLRHRCGRARGPAVRLSSRRGRSGERWSTLPSRPSRCSTRSSRPPGCRLRRPRHFPGVKTRATVVGNSNGGLYLIPASLLPVLAPAWETWARWLLDRRRTAPRLDVPP